MKRLIIPVILLLASCGSDQAIKPESDSLKIVDAWNPSYVKDEIDRLEKLHCALVVSGNGDSLLGLYSEDVRILANQQTIFSGREGVKNYWSVLPDITFAERNMVSLDGTREVLYETGIETITGMRESQQFGGNRKYLTIWKLVDDKYKIAVEMWNDLPPELPSKEPK